MLRSLLVALDGSPWSETATTLALDWAARFDARLIGLGVLDEPSIATSVTRTVLGECPVPAFVGA
jgi:nucleotide-binding universal stress UspA family protein